MLGFAALYPSRGFINLGLETGVGIGIGIEMTLVQGKINVSFENRWNVWFRCAQLHPAMILKKSPASIGEVRAFFLLNNCGWASMTPAPESLKGYQGTS